MVRLRLSYTGKHPVSEENKGGHPAPPAEPGDHASRRPNRERKVVSQSQIIVVSGLQVVSLLQVCVERLRRLGHEVIFYEDPAAFHQAATSLTNVDAVLAASNFACSRALM